MAIVRRQTDPRSVEQRRADERLLARFEGGQALPVTRKAVEEAARRVRRRNADRRKEVARLGIEITELRRTFGLTQAEIARAIGTSKPNICKLLLDDAIDAAGLGTQMTTLDEQNQKVAALGLALNWGVRTLLAYAAEASRRRARGSRDRHDLAWIRSLVL